MGHHYVPRKYLRGFCEPGSDSFLWMFDKQEETFKRMRVDVIAQARQFYTPEVESQLEEFVEGPANAVIDKLRQRTSIDSGDRARLPLYVATMLRRVPHSRQRAAGWLPEVLADTVREMKDFISQAAAAGHISPSTEAERLAQADAAEEKFKKNPPQNVVEQIRTPWPTEREVQVIFAMTWRFLSTAGPSYYLTSDNPAFFFEDRGLARAESELTFPISSTLALHANWELGGQGRTYRANQQAVKELNRRTASSATRFLFYRERASWIASVAKKGTGTRLNTIRWDI